MAVTCEERFAPNTVTAQVICVMCRRDICCGDRYTAMTKPNPDAILGYDVLGNYCHHCMPESPCEVLCIEIMIESVGTRPCAKCGRLLRPGDPAVKSGIRRLWYYDNPPLSVYCPQHSPCKEAAA